MEFFLYTEGVGEEELLKVWKISNNKCHSFCNGVVMRGTTSIIIDIVWPVRVTRLITAALTC